MSESKSWRAWLLLFACAAGLRPKEGSLAVPTERALRIATFNASLHRDKAFGLIEALRGGEDPQAKAIAEIIQRTRPEVLLLNEFDFDPKGEAAALFQELYLAKSQGGAQPISYPFIYAPPVNTGLPLGCDLDRDGRSDGPGDAIGYGAYPGQYGMLLLSQRPIDRARIRTFQHFLWRDLTGADLPDDPKTEAPADYYSQAILERLSLSSKTHVDVPILARGRRIHLLCSHPTPPVFDGPEDRNGRRNADEIRFWVRYLSPGLATRIRDDQGLFGGLAPDAHFVILGDLNADPHDGESLEGAISALLNHERVMGSMAPQSEGGAEAATRQGGINARHRGDPKEDTADFSERGSGNLRVDYVLPSKTLRIHKAEVFWPTQTDPLFRLVGTGDRVVSSDHRLVFLDVLP